MGGRSGRSSPRVTASWGRQRKRKKSYAKDFQLQEFNVILLLLHHAQKRNKSVTFLSRCQQIVKDDVIRTVLNVIYREPIARYKVA